MLDVFHAVSPATHIYRWLRLANGPSRFRSQQESAETIRDPSATKQNNNDFGFGDFSSEGSSLHQSIPKRSSMQCIQQGSAPAAYEDSLKQNVTSPSAGSW
jgi:hypothetical protein